MAMMSKALKGLGKGALKIGKALTTENNIADGGGLSSLIIRRKEINIIWIMFWIQKYK